MWQAVTNYYSCYTVLHDTLMETPVGIWMEGSDAQEEWLPEDSHLDLKVFKWDLKAMWLDEAGPGH